MYQAFLPTHDKASLLDPRFKDQYVEKRDATMEAVKLECLPLVPATSAPVVYKTEPDNPPHTKKAKSLVEFSPKFISI